MPYVVCKHPAIRMDIAVKKEYMPQLVGYIDRMGCRYEREKIYEPGNGQEYVLLQDIYAQRGRNIGELIGLFYSLEWGHLVEGKEQDKFYILLNPRGKKKGGKKNVCKDREEADTGCEGGDRGEPAVTAGPEQMGGFAGDRADIGPACVDDPGEFPGLPSTCDGRCE